MYSLMTLVIFADAFIGFENLVGDKTYSGSTYQRDASVFGMLYQNWKSHLFHQSCDSSMKTLAFALLTLQDIFSFSAIFALSGPEVMIEK